MSHAGFEPATNRFQWICSTNWANGPSGRNEHLTIFLFHMIFISTVKSHVYLATCGSITLSTQDRLRSVTVTVSQSHAWCHKAFHFYIQSFRLNMLGWTQGVCLYVCVCVCVCLSVCLSVCVCHLYSLKGMNRFWRNFPQMIWQIFAGVNFRGFWNFEFDDVMAAILHFCVAALSQSQFLSNIFQIWTQGILVYANVCFW